MLLKKDIIQPFTLNSEHYYKVIAARRAKNLPTSNDYKIVWDCRVGFDITGKPLETKYHPYHDMWLVDKKTQKEYQIDTICYLHHGGYYVSLSVREKNSLSHKIVWWKNISCHNDIILNHIKENQIKYTLKRKNHGL